jgi:tetratricopeptide (TPR) repeat protein
MRRRVAWEWTIAVALAAFAAAPALHAQSDQQPAQSGQKSDQGAQNGNAQKPAAQGNPAAAGNPFPEDQQSGQESNQGAQNGNAQKPPPQGNPAAGGNPFPEDEKSVPLMPAANAPDFSADMNGDSHAAAPAVDKDPVRSPDDEAPDASNSSSGFSSSSSGLGNVMAPPPDEPTRKGKNGDDSGLDTFPKETPKEDVNVGMYYLENHDWKGALSRFQSALVLAPDNPDVYWGLAESERHLGQYASARANYLKVMEYDPGSHHAKDAKKALRDPELANAKPADGHVQP